MMGGVDPRLVDFLKGSLNFADALRDAGLRTAPAISLGRGDGLHLLALVSGASDAVAEEWSQRGRRGRPGWNSLDVAGLTYEWPRPALNWRAAANANDCRLNGVEWFVEC